MRDPKGRDACTGALVAGAVCFPDPPSTLRGTVAQSELDSSRTQGNKHNEFFSVVAEFRTRLSYGEVDRGPDLPRVHPGGRCTSTPRHQSNLRRDDEEGLDSDVINLLGARGGASALESFHNVLFRFFFHGTKHEGKITKKCCVYIVCAVEKGLRVSMLTTVFGL